MTEATQLPYEIVLDPSTNPVAEPVVEEPEADTDPEDNPKFDAALKKFVICGGAAAGTFFVSDVVGDLIVSRVSFLTATPGAIWIMPIGKLALSLGAFFVAAKSGTKDDLKYAMIGAGAGLAADAANDIITLFGVRTKLGVPPLVEVV